MALSDPLPHGWHENLLDKADLERSFAALEGREHFLAEGWRGRLCSFELRCDEAWDHFDRANDLSLREEQSIPNLVAQFHLYIWSLENAVADSPVMGDGFDDTPNIPEVPHFIVESYPIVGEVLRERRLWEGIVRLYLGEYALAAHLFERLASEDLERSAEMLAFDSLCLAAARHNADLREEALLELRKAALAARTTARTLHKGFLGAIIVAFKKYLGDGAAASWWQGFVERLECPERTREVFLRRADLVLERCLEEKRLLVV